MRGPLPTGEGTSRKDDVADPHPSTEGHPDLIRNPGEVEPVDENKDIGPNPAVHDGTPPPRPDNVETEPDGID